MIATQARYAGIASRAVALAVDVALANLVVLAGGGIVRLIASLVGGLRPEWLADTLSGTGWALIVGTYFVAFWAVSGQTPGMRLMRLRVLAGDGDPPRLAAAALRLLGLVLCIVPFFAGFLPVLFDARRRGLHDMLAGTVVVYDEPDIDAITLAG